MRQLIWIRLLLILALVLPVAMLFLLPGGVMYASGWFWLALMLSFILVWLMLGVPTAEAGPQIAPAGPRPLLPEEQPRAIRDVMDVQTAVEQEGVQAYRGVLKEPAADAFEHIKQAAGPQAVPLMQEDEQHNVSVLLLPRPVQQSIRRPLRYWMHVLLFALTFITTTMAGAAHQGVDLTQQPQQFWAGLPYSISLLAILGVHELGHYFTAKYHGIDVTPPFFIPVPFALGTFGAFIQMRSPTENRRALFDVAVAGPLAGLAIAIPALMIGLRFSQVVPIDPAAPPSLFSGTPMNSSIMFVMLAKLSLGDAVQYGQAIQMHPAAFAGWLGLFITALNLLPIGQLDGGHMARGMFGSRVGSTISSVAMWTLLLLALFVWPGLFMWAIIVFFLAGRGMPPLNDITPVNTGRRLLGYASFFILLLILAPLPRGLWGAGGIRCPYL